MYILWVVIYFSAIFFLLSVCALSRDKRKYILDELNRFFLVACNAECCEAVAECCCRAVVDSVAEC
jgi:hypothetical protein